MSIVRKVKDDLFEIECDWCHPYVQVTKHDLDEIVRGLQLKEVEKYDGLYERSLLASPYGAVIEVLNEVFGTNYEASPNRLQKNLPIERERS